MNKLWLILAALLMLIAFIFCGFICGCASQDAKEGGAALGAGFQSASGNKLETGDIGDKAGGNIDKAVKQGGGIQIINDPTFIVVLMVCWILIREFFAYMKLKYRK